LRPFFVLGTRPEIVKLAPIIKECENRKIKCFLLHTGQHYSKFMSELFLKDLGLREPDRNLNIGSGTHGEQTAKALVGIEKELVKEKPDVVLVQGDTNAVLSAALASVKMGIPVAHVEAGLRSYDTRMPEEHNRRLTDHVSSYLFAPTQNSAENLRKEDVWGKIFVTGNTVIDTLEERLPAARKWGLTIEDVEPNAFILLTLHRAENVDNKKTLSGLVDGLLQLETNIVFPAHPRTVARLEKFGLMEKLLSRGTVHIIEPTGYLDFLALLDSCSYVLTDSGGIQEEVTAPTINKRVFVLRTSTERPEAVESGHASVVGVNPSEFPKAIQIAVRAGLNGKRSCPYGDGTASQKIVSILLDELG
jgi:UDP-N-acetylglucosamine 2-epimerase (non-hydrolysing)